jgi:CheY-like chemotaxis protein
MELMGVSICFESDGESVSTFWIELTLVEELELYSDNTGFLKKTEHPKGQAVKILYVEDTPSNIELMGVVVQDLLGMNMVSAPTAELGIEIARAELPDLIIMDINLPGISGIEARRQLAGMDQVKNIPVIALSASASKTHVAKGLKEGFKHYMTKPFDINEMAKVIRDTVS